MTDAAAVCDPNAEKHPDCKACKQSWPIHVYKDGRRSHIYLFATKEYGIEYPCPTQVWPE